MFEQLIDPQKKPSQYSPLVLAYIGDAVYELYIRQMLLMKGNMPVHKLHRQATTYVKAKAQSNIVLQIMSELTEEEIRIYKRGRNAKSGTTPKNANIGDYRRATGFEALIGYLYLKGEVQRLTNLLELAIDRV